jgi:hypothetical protein
MHGRHSPVISVVSLYALAAEPINKGRLIKK